MESHDLNKHPQEALSDQFKQLKAWSQLMIVFHHANVFTRLHFVRGERPSALLLVEAFWYKCLRFRVNTMLYVSFAWLNFLLYLVNIKCVQPAELFCNISLDDFQFRCQDHLSRLSPIYALTKPVQTKVLKSPNDDDVI